MATLLMIQCNRLVSGVQYPGISSIAAFVKRAGHEILFFDTANYTVDKNMGTHKLFRDKKSRIELDFRHINRDAMPLKRTIKAMLTDLERNITDNKIDIIGFSSFSDDWPFTLFLIKRVKTILPSVPIIVGGVHASLAPQEVIKHPQVSMVCVGEGELALVELLDSIDGEGIDLQIKNLWIKQGGEIFKNPQRSFLEFDNNFPMLDWTLYNDIHFIYPYEGKLFRRGSVTMGRGCPYSCNFCINSSDMSASNYGGHLLKPISFLREEIVYLKSKYRLDFLRFWDETFLAKPRKYLEEFSNMYKKEIRLPFTIETTAKTINHENVKMLAEMGCQSISVGVETSNERIRTKILNKIVTNEEYERCFKIITEYGLRKVANFMFFLPHQTIEDMWNDVYLSAKWKINHPSARIFYPYVGTQLREYCIRNQMIDLDLLKKVEDEESIKDIDDLKDNWITFQDTVLKIETKTKSEGLRILDNFILYQETDHSIYNRLTQLLTNDTEENNNILKEIEYDIYKKRFGEEPLLL